MESFADVRTKSLPTAAILMLLGHEPLDVRRDAMGAAIVRFTSSAEEDLRRYHAAKRQIEQFVAASVQ